MHTDPLPVLYSFRRCPYAIRARMALYYAAINIELVEVSLKNKPQAMLVASPKGTVPVLCAEGKVLDESLDIMLWALTLNDPDCWYVQQSETNRENISQLVKENDNCFKPWLDKYKYADRHPEQTQDFYRTQCEVFILKLEHKLATQSWLSGTGITLSDIAIFPFIRQFSMVDQTWFEQSPYPHTRQWLQTLLTLPLFLQVMAKTHQHNSSRV